MQTPGRRVEPQISLLPLERRMDGLERRLVSLSGKFESIDDTVRGFRRVEPQISLLPLERRMDSLERRFISFSNAQQPDEDTSIRGLGRIVLEMEQMQNNMEAMQKEIRRDLREREKYFKEEQKLLKKDLKNTEDFKTAALFDLRKIIGLFGFAVAANELSQGDIGGAIQGVGLGIGSFLPEITTAVVGILAAKGLIGGGMMGGGMVAGGGRRLLGGGMMGGGRMAGGLGLLGGKGKGILALAALGGLLLTGGALAGGGNTSRMQVGDKKIDDGNDVLNRSDTLRFRRQLNRFGAILDDVGKESTTAAKSDEGIGQVNEKFEKNLKDISKSSPDKIKKFKSTEVKLPDEVEPQEFNKGGQVPGSGNTDTVPAMLTPGEVVMSKPAVDKIGADNLLAMNAAGGGTNKPTLGYRFGQVNPDTILSSSEVFTEKTTDSHSTKKGGILSKIFDRDFESFKEKDLSGGGPGLSMQTIEKYKEGNLRGESILTEDIASVGVPDIMEHQEDLMKRINAVKGFEDKTIDDVIGGTVGMNAQQYTRLLNSSDAARATEKKREEARKLDLELLGTPGKGWNRMLPGFQGGGLVLGKTPMQQVSELRDERREILRNQVDGKMSKEDKKRYKYITNKLNLLATQIKADNKVPGYNKISTPTAPIVPETKNIKPIETKEVPSSMIAQPIITNIPGKTTNMPPPAPSGDEFGSEKFVSINTRFQGSIDKLDSAYTLNSYAALQ